jgi:hypothetical protein
MWSGAMWRGQPSPAAKTPHVTSAPYQFKQTGVPRLTFLARSVSRLLRAFCRKHRREQATKLREDCFGLLAYLTRNRRIPRVVARDGQDLRGWIRGNAIQGRRDHEDGDVQIVNLARVNETAGSAVLDEMAGSYEPLSSWRHRLRRRAAEPAIRATARATDRTNRMKR